MVYITLGVLLFLLIGIGAGAANPDKLKEVREKHEHALLTTEGVAGVAQDDETQEIVILVETAEHAKKIPRELDGFKVRTEITGRLQALGTEAISSPLYPLAAKRYSRTGRTRPSVFGGISVGNAGYPTISGTLGLVVIGTGYQETTLGQPYVLSNAHVLALGSNVQFLPKGTYILQPGGADGGLDSDYYRIGKLSNWIPIVFNDPGATNYADAAIGSLTATSRVGDVLNSRNNGFYHLSGSTTVSYFDTVRKSGRTSGVSQATVIYPSSSVKVYYSDTTYATFSDQIITTVMSKPGDSGSAVDKGGKFVGLLFAGSNSITVVSKAQHILSPLGIDVK
jgi:hypothetical protein